MRYRNYLLPARGLIPDTELYVFVQADCVNGNTSDWLPMLYNHCNFNPHLNLNQQVQLFPNPANEFYRLSRVLFDYVEVVQLFRTNNGRRQTGEFELCLLK
jgi:hypothetical protein